MIETSNEITEIPEEKTEEYFWGLPEVIYAVIAMIAISVAMLVAVERLGVRTSGIMIAYELMYLLPVVIVMLIKKAPWRSLSIKDFDFVELLVGVSILFAAYIVIFIHNLVLVYFGIAPQSEYIIELFGLNLNIWVLGIVIVIIAPIAEEIFFRSFIYVGLLKRFGWKKAAFISALIFGLAHMQLVSLFPTFLMGLVFAYLYQRTKSVVPGIILHFLVNAFGFTMIILLLQMEGTLF